MKLKEALGLIVEFVKLTMKIRPFFYGEARIIWVEGKIKTVEIKETYMSTKKPTRVP
jgi:hypothetical protein